MMLSVDAIRNQILVGDALNVLKQMPPASVNCVVTSPPYYGLRDYDESGQIGMEDTHLDYVARLRDVFMEVYRVLRPDGTLWLNLGDTYAGGTAGRNDGKSSNVKNGTHRGDAAISSLSPHFRADTERPAGFRTSGQSKNLLGIPWRVALALQDAGWILRADIIWSKPSCIPESVKDRPTRSHEYVFLFAKSRFYHFDMDAFREPAVGVDKRKPAGSKGTAPNSGRRGDRVQAFDDGLRNRRTVWEVATASNKTAHSAVFPPDLIRPMIEAGCPTGGIVLDPFMGSGTTGAVAIELGVDYVGIELNADYAAIARNRLAGVPRGLPLLAELKAVG